MITRRHFLSQGMAAAGLAAGAARAAGDAWNVLFLAVDDLRPELGCYGNPAIHTPNLDRLAARSLLFRRAYCQAAVCGATRASLLTGLRPDSTRVWGNDTNFRDTIPDAVTLPQRFKQAGWQARSFGKILHGKMSDEASWSVPQWPEGGRQAGMQYVDEERFAQMRQAEPSRAWKGDEIPTLEWKKHESWQAPDVPDNALQDGQVADRAVAALRELREERFFLAVGFQKPHLPFTAPKKYFDLYDPAALPVAEDVHRPVDAPDLAFTNSQELRGYSDIPRKGPLPPGKARELVHGYYAAASYMDAQAGRVLGELDRLGLAATNARHPVRRPRLAPRRAGPVGQGEQLRARYPCPADAACPRHAHGRTEPATASSSSWTCTRRYAMPAASMPGQPGRDQHAAAARRSREALEAGRLQPVPAALSGRRRLDRDGLHHADRALPLHGMVRPREDATRAGAL